MDKPTEKSLLKSFQDMNLSTLAVFKEKFFSHLKLEGECGVTRFKEGLKEKTTHKDRLIYIHEKLRNLKLLQDRYIEDHKSDSATKYKGKGDKFFATGQYAKALRSYTKSLMRAKEQKLLATVYANRSAALLKLGLYKECLIDIERAFINDYDEHLKPQLAERRRKVTELLPTSKVKKFHEEVPAFPTNKIEIQTCRTGHKVVATETIQIGDIIVIEEPLVSIIGDSYLNHCHECFELCYNPIPCDMCTQALYCNQTCKRKAFVSYHKHECPILKSVKRLVGSEFPLVLAVKMFFQYGEQLSNEIFQLMENTQNQKFLNQLDFEITAAVMYELVKNYTKKFGGPNGEAAERSFQDNIVALIQVSLLQYSGVDELCPDDDGMFIKRDLLATSIYPFYKKFRHSCAPSIFTGHYGVKRVLRAYRTIEKGREVLMSFGPHYTKESREKRQSFLSTFYHFTCTCRACTENWDQIGKQPGCASSDDLIFITQMQIQPDVEVTKRRVPQQIEKIKNLEGSEPSIELATQQRILIYCYDIFGNKQLVQ